MKRLALALIVALLGSCTLTGPGGEELDGIPVEKVAAILRGVADEVELWDVDKNGVIDGNEYLPLGLGVTSRILTAMTTTPDVAPDR